MRKIVLALAVTAALSVTACAGPTDEVVPVAAVASVTEEPIRVPAPVPTVTVTAKPKPAVTVTAPAPAPVTVTAAPVTVTAPPVVMTAPPVLVKVTQPPVTVTATPEPVVPVKTMPAVIPPEDRVAGPASTFDEADTQCFATWPNPGEEQFVEDCIDAALTTWCMVEGLPATDPDYRPEIDDALNNCVPPKP